MRNTALFCQALLVAVTLIVTTESYAQHAERQPIPADQELDQVIQEAKRFYQSDLNQARSDDQRRALAEKLRRDAVTSAGDSAGKYSLLRLSQNLAIENGDRQLTLNIADDIASKYAISNAHARSDAMLRLTDTKRRLSRDDRIAIAREAIENIDALLDEGNIQLAQQLVAIASDFARSTRQFLLSRLSREIEADLATLDDEYQKFVQATKDFEPGKNTAESNSIMGRFNCFVINNWDKGLAQLVDGSDPQLKDLASASISEMRDSATTLNLADRWWDFGNGLSGRRQRVIKRFAASLYVEAMPDILAADKERAEARITASESLVVESPESISKAQNDVNQESARRNRTRGVRSPMSTTIGKIKLSEIEINHFLDACRAEKPRLLGIVQQQFNSRASNMTPGEAFEAQELFRFLSQDNVLIVPRGRDDGQGAIFKPTAAALTIPFSSVETQQIIDKDSMYITASYFGKSVILEGVDTKVIPPARWPCYLLFKAAGTKQIPGIIGNQDVDVYHAVSNEGFPKDIILW